MTTGPVVVALGDSVTVGVGDAVWPDAVHGSGWAAHLATLLGASAFTNLAGNGARTRDVRGAQLPAALALTSGLPDGVPVLATVFAGGNDVLRSDFDAREVERDLHAVVRGLRGAGVDVVLARLPPIGLFELAPAAVRAVVRRRVAAVGAAVESVRARPDRGPGSLVLLDATAAIVVAGDAAWHVDRVHPSAAGHRRLACAAAAALATADPRYATALGGPSAVGERLPAAPPPPTLPERVSWLLAKGLPWCVRRGGDFLPGLVRAVVAEVRADRGPGQAPTLAGVADPGREAR